MSSKGIALVTGAAQGIGRAIALRLADDGFDVAVNDIDAHSDKLAALVDEIQKKGRASSTCVTDVSQEDQVKEMVETVVKQHGGLDVMVANAGVLGRSWMPLTEDAWDSVMNVNAKGNFLCYKYAGIQMIKQGRGGRIIGASSEAGKQGIAMQAAYTASKFAVRGLTQTASLEFAKHGITVNAYAPGAIINTAIANESGPPPGAESTFPELAARKQVGIPTDISSLVSFLASKESQFITGQTISINGGSFFD